MRTLDLHGYQVSEVFDAVDRFVLEESRKGASKARIMTGKGTGAVQKQTVAYLKKAGYPWAYEKINGIDNTGVLIVFLE